MSEMTVNRRSLLQMGGGLWATTALGMNFSVIAAAAKDNRKTREFVAISTPLGATLESVTARIIPTTDTPGAREAGAIWFIDAAMAAEMAEALPLLEAGAAQLNEAANGSFLDAAAERQDQILKAIENGEFFSLVHILTIAGTFTMPRYGGNQNEVGWALLDFKQEHFWAAPFGFYDRNAHGSTTESPISESKPAHTGSHSDPGDKTS